MIIPQEILITYSIIVILGAILTIYITIKYPRETTYIDIIFMCLFTYIPIVNIVYILVMPILIRQANLYDDYYE